MLVSGDIESDEYERQAGAMAAVWAALGYPLSRLELPGYNHFTMADQLRDPESDLTRAVMAQMGVAL